MSKNIILISTLILLLTACGNQPKTIQNDDNEYVMSEIRKDDFVLQVYSDKQIYALEEEVNVYTKLKYIGNNASQTVYHEASPFYYNVFEITRQVGIPYSMDQPGLSTELKNDIWYEERYMKTGVFSESFPKSEFNKEFLEVKGFPGGEYRMSVRAKISTGQSTKQENYELSTSITIKIE